MNICAFTYNFDFNVVIQHKCRKRGLTKMEINQFYSSDVYNTKRSDNSK